MVYRLCYFLFASVLLWGASATSWWLLGVNKDYSLTKVDSVTCSSLSKELGTYQINNFCVYNEKTINLIALGTRDAIVACQIQFSNWRWNCTTFEGDNLFGKFINNNTRETAIVNSLLAAGAGRRIAAACRDEKLPNCTCKVDGTNGIVNSTYITYDCSYNGDVAEKLMLDFFEESDTSNYDNWNIVKKVENRNHKIGFNVLKDTALKCRCHGFSGACNVQTCYRISPTAEEMAAVIGSKPTVQVITDTVGRLIPVNKLASLNETNDLVSLKNSPTFCYPDTPQGIIGTSGRQCKIELGHPDSCEVLCCGRGHVTISVVETDECCDFIFCCYYKCEVCNHRTVIKYYCN